MTTYTFKFNIGEPVWTIMNNKAMQVTVVTHKVEASEYLYRDGNRIYKVLDKTRDTATEQIRHEHEMFGTKEELLESL